MHLSQWLRQLSQRWSLHGRNPRRRAGRVCARARRWVRPCLEVLEGRIVPSTFTVTTTADSGPGSLRQAMLDANANPGKDTIKFDFSNPNLTRSFLTAAAIDTGGGQSSAPTFPHGVVVIEPTSRLPDITDPVVIDGSQSGLGTTQPVPGVEIRGDLVGNGPSGLLLYHASGSEIYGLVINSWDTGIHLTDSSNVTIEDCDLGVTFVNTNATPNHNGLRLDTGSSSNNIRDCIVVNSDKFGVLLQDNNTSDNTLQGNLIVGNNAGIELLHAANNVIGNVTPGQGNLILNNGIGVSLTLGTDGAPGSPDDNLLVNNQINYNNEIGIDIDGGDYNQVGGSGPGSSNMITQNGQGIVIEQSQATKNLVQGNFISANTVLGIDINGAVSNQIGGTGAGEANVITQNGEGVVIEQNQATGNLVQGNYIGILSDGSTTDSQGNSTGNGGAGVRIWNAPNNTIDGNTVALTNSSQAADIPIDDPNQTHYFPAGIVVGLPSATSNVISNNHIGTDPAGDAALGNYGDGILITGASKTIVRGNVISGTKLVPNSPDDPGGDAIHLTTDDAGDNATRNLIEDNFIGTDATATKSLGNADIGVFLDGVSGNTIGATSGNGNVISGSAFTGIFIQGSGGSGNQIMSNRIGTDISGTTALPNQKDGIDILNAPNTTVGGDASTAQNVISGNGQNGVGISGTGATGTVLQGNLIGTDASGEKGLGNTGPGVFITNGASGTQLGGASNTLGNLISGNNGGGILLAGGATGNNAQGNFIGLDRNGSKAIGNGNSGVAIVDAPGNLIGGPIQGDGNVISGNNASGIFVHGAKATANILEGNTIGTDDGGGVAIQNAGDGILVVASGNFIGGTTAFAGNSVAGNQNHGIRLASDTANGITASNNLVEGNSLGGATFTVPNGGYGIALFDAPNNLIGGTTSGAGNIIHDNTQGDVLLQGAGTTGNTLQGNTIGRSQNNPDPKDAIDINGAPKNTIGGTAAGAGNTIRYHAGGGVFITAANGTTIQGNTISANQKGGVTVSNSSGTIIGGSRAGGASNSISGNADHGVFLDGSKTQNTQLLGNDILGNQTYGVAIGNGPSNNQIGGDSTDLANTISGTFGGAGEGILIHDGTGNAILVNSISDNAGLGIDLGGDGVTPNDPGDADSGANGLQNYPVLLSAAVVNGTTTIRGYINTTPNTSITLRFFSSPNPNASGHGEGQNYLGTLAVTTDTGGNATFTATFSTALSPGTVVTATASAPDPAGGTDTSEFAQDVRLPADEFQVNTVSAGNQFVGYGENVGTDANGNFVVVWSGNGPQGQGVYYRRFDASGLPLDPVERRANVTDGLTYGPVVAMAPDGSFVIGWFEGSDIYARRFAADGTSLDSTEFRVSTTSLQVIDGPKIASDSKGNFVLTWEAGNPYGAGNGYDISARRYHADGTPIDAGEFTVNQTLSGDERFPSVAMAPNGDFIIGWLENNYPANAPLRLVARRFSLSGSTASNEFTLNSSTVPGSGLALVLAGNGELLASWGNTDGAIEFRRFDASNNPLDTHEVSVTNQGALPSVGFKSDDSFVIAWQTSTDLAVNATEDSDIMYRLFGADGTPQAPALKANSQQGGRHQYPSLSVAPNDTNFVIVWDSVNQDGSGDGVFARRFGPVNNPPNVYPLFGETGPGKPIQLTLSGDSGDPGVTQALTYAIATNPSHGTVSNFNAATGAFTYAPAAGFTGSDSFTVTVVDDNSLGAPARTSSPATVSIVVVPSPVITGVSPDTGTSAADGITSGNPPALTGTALAQSVVTVSQAGTGVLGTARADANGIWSYTLVSPLADGNYTFTADVRDSSNNVLVSSAHYKVTVDTTPPTSSVQPLPASTSAPAFLVSWSGTDAGSGIVSYDVFVSDNGASFVPFQIATTATSAAFMGQSGHHYGFYSIATDIAGNRQATPTAAQATIFIAPPPPALPPAPPALNVPPLLALFDSLLAGVETVNANGTETITDSVFGFPLLVATFDHSGKLMSVDLFGIDITFLFG